ncbi:MAG: c-type cytochrome biogenesis protein CcmI [Burkholderiales bacterium]
MVSSPLFWIVVLALVAGTLAWLVIPLLRRTSAADGPEDATAAAAVYRDHKRQIEADLAAGAITPEERDAALAELTQRFGQELAGHGEAKAAHVGERTRWIAAGAIVACVPVVAGLLYFSLGNPAAMSGATAASHNPNDDAQMVAMVDQLAKRLQANPEDGEGWALLGRSYRVLNRYDAAVMAYNEAAKRLPPNAALYADWAESVAQAQGKTLVGQPTDLLEKAIKIDPDSQKALALLGAAALERGDRAQAIATWTKLRGLLPPDSPQVQQLDAALAQAGAAPPPAQPASAPKPATPAPSGVTAAASPKPPPPTAAPAAAPAASGPAVAGRVELDSKLAKNVAPGDVVFIFARDPDGPRMPLAAIRAVASELPYTFSMTDAMAMTPAATISKASKVVIEARVSKSGDVKAQPGDLTGVSAPVAPGAKDVRVIIDRVIP